MNRFPAALQPLMGQHNLLRQVEATADTLVSKGVEPEYSNLQVALRLFSEQPFQPLKIFGALTGRYRYPLLDAQRRQLESTRQSLNPKYKSFEELLHKEDIDNLANNGTLLFGIRHGLSMHNVMKVFQGTECSDRLVLTGRFQAELLARALPQNLKLNSILSSALNRAYDTAASIAASHADSPEITVMEHLREMDSGILQGWPKDRNNEKKPMSVADFDRLLEELSTPQGRRKMALDITRSHTSISETDLEILYADMVKTRNAVRDYAEENNLEDVNQFIQQQLARRHSVEEGPIGGEGFRESYARAMSVKTSLLDTLGNGAHVLVSHGTYLKELFGVLGGLSLEEYLQGPKSMTLQNTSLTIWYKPNGTENWRLMVLNDAQHLQGEKAEPT